jgi:hypothetical protein
VTAAISGRRTCCQKQQQNGQLRDRDSDTDTLPAHDRSVYNIGSAA